MDELNAEQRRAAEAPVMIVAGPGTGKTKTLVARIWWLISSGRARPAEILVLTFTAKAAAEVRQRLVRLLGADAGVRVGTFHAVALDALGSDGRAFVSEPERLEVIRSLERPSALAGQSVRELALRLSRHKNGAGDGDAAVRELAEAYSRALSERNLRDFDDVLIAWREQLAAAAGEPAWRQVLIDEFQDTSEVQYEIMRLLGAHGNVFVIGDPRQSIYGFRGAGERMFERFAEDFPTHLAVSLTVNYLSHAAIVELANGVFGGDDALDPYQMLPGQVRIVETLAEGYEADFVVGEIEQLLGGTDLLRVSSAEANAHYHFADIAIIYRTHRAARTLARRLAASGLPYQMAGGDGPYGRPAIRNVMAVVAGCGGEVLAGVGLGEDELAHLVAIAPANLAPSALVGWAADRLGLADEDDRLALSGLAGALVRYDTRPDGRAQAAQYVVALEANEYYDPAATAITLLTIHAAKGLEFPVVFVIGANEGGLPHLRADGGHDIEEEKRLFYVAVTRARERLDVVYARNRGGQTVAPSRFLDGLSAQRLVDPALAAQQRKRTTGRAKRAQGTLF